MSERVKQVLDLHGGKIAITVSASVLLTVMSLVYNYGRLTERVDQNSTAIKDMRTEVRDGFKEIRGLVTSERTSPHLGG